MLGLTMVSASMVFNEFRLCNCSGVFAMFQASTLGNAACRVSSWVAKVYASPAALNAKP